MPERTGTLCPDCRMEYLITSHVHPAGLLCEACDRKFVPCKYCATPTASAGTGQCDSCWEVAGRLAMMEPLTVSKILMDVRPQEQWKAR